MPKVKDGKISFNLKIDKDTYTRWVDAMCDMRMTNLSAFIRDMVDKGIDYAKRVNSEETTCH